MKAAFALACAALAVAPAALAVMTTARTPTSSAQTETVTRTGPVREWRLAADGTVYVQLGHGSARSSEGSTEAREAGDAGELVWFRSPSIQTTTRDFENMFMKILVASKDENSGLGVITVVGEIDIERDPTTLEGAHEIVYVGS